MERRGDIEILRFLASIGIMVFHAYYFLDLPQQVLGGGHIFVELFFMLSGYYTARHFDMIPPKQYDIQAISQDSVNYTLKKIGRIYPVFFASVIATYFIKATGILLGESGGFKQILGLFSTLPGELLLLHSTAFFKFADVFIYAQVGPGWYISSLLWILPVVCICLILGKKFTRLIIAPCSFFLIYAHRGFSMRKGGADDLFRAFACLMLGTFLYELSMFLKAHKPSMVIKKCSTVLVMGMLSAICYLIHGSKIQALNIVVLLMFLVLAIMLSDLSIFTLHNSAANRLGKMSIFIFLIQSPVGVLLKLLPGLGSTVQQVLYYGFTILISVFTCKIHRKFIN